MIFNPELIVFSHYALWPTIAGILLITYGASVYIRERGSQIGRRYLLFAASVGLYLFGAGVSYAVVSRENALLWEHIAHIGVAVIPLAMYIASTTIVGQTRQRVILIRIVGAATAAFLVTLLVSDLFIAGNRLHGTVYYPVYGPMGFLFIAYFVAVMVLVIACCIREIRSSSDPLLGRRLRVVTTATIIGFVGGVDFLPAIGINIYGFGYIPVTLFVAIMGYAITRYRLVDLTPDIAAPAILQTMPSGVIVTDRNNVVRLANPTAGALLEISTSLIDHTLESIAETSDACASFLGISKDEKNVEIYWPLDDGNERTLSVSRSTLRDSSRTRVGTVFIFQDISERKRAEQHLLHMALHDSLTALPNRKLFFDRLEQQVLMAERNARTLAVLYVDLDKFKEINNTYGHEGGDTVLRVTATRIVGSVRNTDTVARVGGDEFTVILSEITEGHDVTAIIGNISRAFEQPIHLDGKAVATTASIGVAVWPEDGSTVEELVSTADRRMYEWKRRR